VPIRRRLTLYAAAIATAGMVLFGALLTGLAANGVVTDQATALARLSDQAARAIEADPSRLAAGAPLVVVDLATSVEPFVTVTTESGEVRYATAFLDGSPPRIPAAVLVEAIATGASTAEITIGAHSFAIHASRWRSSGLMGVAVAGQSVNWRAQQLVGFRVFLIFSAVVTIVAVVLVTRVVVGRALRPLRAAAATADEIARTGDLQRRLPGVRTRDEVGTLTASFNGMLDRLAAARESLATALEAQRRFAADASHELRTPLTTIRTNADFLHSRADATPEDRAEAAADIAAEGERMSRLVDDLLLLARGEGTVGESSGAEASPLVRRPVDLSALAEDVVRRARRPDREVVAVAGDGGGHGAVIVEGDPPQLERLTWILVDNALRHGAGTVSVTVSVAASVAASEVAASEAELVVTDEGPGIPAGMEERVFARFFRADTARTGGGSGLGLAIARSIVARHGGTIAAANGPTGGAVFTVRLPRL
jgi:signal transduction histidine kinase